MFFKRTYIPIAATDSLSLGRLLLPLTCVGLLLLFGPLAQGQYLNSPCPNVFDYLRDHRTNELFGYVELHNLRIGQLVELNVDLSIGAVVPEDNVGSIKLVKSREDTFRDIYNNQPAQYRVNFPLNSAIASVLAIRLNGQNICTGQKATGKIVTTINLEHTLFTKPVASDKRKSAYDDQQRPVQQTQQRLEPQSRVPFLPSPQEAQSALPWPELASPSDALVGLDEICGIPASGSNRLSINGIRSTKGQFPWTVPVFDKRWTVKPKYICGSTIVSMLHLVTAAHCMYHDFDKREASDLLTAPGMYNIDNFLEPNLQLHEVQSFVVHPDYLIEYAETSGYDIAVLRLRRAILYNNLVKPICLWSGSDSQDDIIDTNGLVSGWGITEEGSAKYPSYINATVVHKLQCKRKLGNIVTEAPMFCADGHGAVPCSGDSGSGFAIKRGPKYFIRGIVSVGQFDYSTATCDQHKYVVYTDIAPFRFWMARLMRS